MRDIDAAMSNESEIMAARGITGCTAFDYVRLDNDVVIIQYACSAEPYKLIRKATVNSPAKQRYYKDTRCAIYVRGQRASCVLVKREYMDFTD